MYKKSKLIATSKDKVDKTPKKRGQKPISLSYIFERRDYLNVLLFIYFCQVRGVMQKKKLLLQTLVKPQNPDGYVYNNIIRDTSSRVNSILFVHKSRECLRGYLTKEELKSFSDRDSLEDFYDNLFETEGDLNKRLKYLNEEKYGLMLIKHEHDNRRGTYWCLTEKGLLEIDRFQLKSMVDTLIDCAPDYYREKKKKIFKLLTPPINSFVFFS